MKIQILVVVCLLLFVSAFCQEHDGCIFQAKDSIIEKALEINLKSPINRRFKRLSINSKYLEIKNGYVKYANKNKAPFDFNYLDSLVIEKESDYYIYNEDSIGRIKLVCVYIQSTQELFSDAQFEEQDLNDIFRMFPLKDISVIKISFAPGFSVIYKSEIWIVNGNTKTDLNTYLKQLYTLGEYRTYFLRSD